MEIRIEIVMLDEKLKSKWTHNVAFPIETADKYLDVTSRIMNIGLHKTFYDLKGKGGLNE